MALRSTLRTAGTVVLAAALLVGCGTAAARRPPRAAAAPAPAVIATVGAGALAVYRSPGQSAPYERLTARTTYGSPRVLLVLGERGSWLKVLLPERPDGTTGWVRAAQVRLTRTSYRVVVSLGTHRLTVYDGARPLLATPVATGADRTPTPRGLFYVTDVVHVASHAPWYGPYALGLSGHSPVLTSFAGGDGQVALHGTDHPELVGKSVSHGCVRLPNAVIARLAHTLPLGTPVTVEA